MKSPRTFTHRASLALLVALFALPAAAGPGVHEHGAAKLDVTVEGALLTLRFETPLDNLVGFETAPRNDRQRTAVRRMAERFHRPQELFVPTAEAGCTPTAIALASDVIPADLLAAPGVAAAAGKSRGGKGHADLDADVTFSCARPEALKGLQIKAFEAFPKLRRIDAAVVTGKGQSGLRLTPKRAALTW